MDSRYRAAFDFVPARPTVSRMEVAFGALAIVVMVLIGAWL